MHPQHPQHPQHRQPPNPPALPSILRSLATLALTIGSIVPLAMARADVTVLTDDRTISVPADTASPRPILWTPAVPVAGGVNGTVDEYEPRISGDGTTMVFVRRRPGSNADLYAARWTPQGWTDPAPIERINGERDELGPELSRDGARLYFYSDREGGLGGYDLWCSERLPDGAGWSEPTNLGPAVNSSANEYGPGLTPDGSRLYFASNRPRPDEPRAAAGDAWTATLRERRQRNDYDLYVATGSPASNGSWTTATLLEAVSSPADDGSPAVSPAGDFLYLASDRDGGLGGYDLYRLRLAPDGSPLEGAAIESLGDAINSPANELDPGLASEGFRLYFSSDRLAQSPAGDAPRDEAARTPGYELFTAVSREVREATEASPSVAAAPSASWGSLWASIWPWLLLALLLALLAWLLALLFAHHDRWRRRIGQMGLLAQCLLLSLLLHLLVAALLAAWKVGGIVADQLSGGGHRVILATAPADGPTGDLAHQIRNQIRAELTDATLPDSALELAAAAPAMVAAAPATLPPLRPDPMVSEPLPTDAPTAQPETSLAESALADATPIEARVQQPTAPAPSAAVEETLASAADQPSVDVPATAPLAAALAPTPIAPSAPVALSPAALPSPAIPTSNAADSAREAAAVPPPPSAAPIAPPTDLAGAPAPARPAAAAPSAPAEESAMASLADRVEAIERSRPTDAPALPSSADAASSIAPEALVASRVPQVSGASDSPATELDTPAPTPSLLPSGLSTASSDATTPRLPAAPAPLEDFAQRDPSLRSELLADMGGNAETEKAVGRALEWLRRHQEREGHWSSRRHGGEVDADAAMTGLALLTFLGAGHTHQAEGPYRETVARGLEWLRARQRSDGDLRHASGATAGAPRSGSTGSDTMYGQTIATVALCEAYAMTRDASLAPAARSAIQFVLARAADAQRGRASAQDTAVLGWLVMTIETARRAGFAPPTEIFRQAQQWLDGIAVSRDGGRYAYRPGERSSPAMTAEAMFVQQLVGRTAREPRMAESAEYLLTAPPRWSSDAPTHHWYYATLALFQHQGEPWERWNEALTRELLAHQRSDGTMDGSWDPQDRWSRAGGRVYQTAVCALSLEVYYRYRVPTQREVTLPSEQRSRQPRPE